MYIVSEILLYICFAVVTGKVILDLVPSQLKPSVDVPRPIVSAALVGIIVFSFAQVIKLILFFVNLDYELAFVTFTVLTDYKVGNGMIATVLLAAGLEYLLSPQRNIFLNENVRFVRLALLAGLILSFGWSSHAATIYEWSGFLAQTAHVLGITVWLGVMFAIAFFARDSLNWLAFLKWFTPTAMICVLILTIAGIALVNDLAPEYVRSWILPYGQALLIKHIIIVPLLFMAFINGILIRSILGKQPTFNPIPWLRVESGIALLVLLVTGIMGQQAPPHNVSETLEEESPSRLFLTFYQEVFDPQKALLLSLNPISICLLIIGGILLLTVLYVVLRKKTHWLTVPVIGAAICVGYFSVLYALIQ